MPDQITHIHLRRGDVAECYAPGSPEYYLGIFSLWFADADELLNFYPTLKPLYQNGPLRLHTDAVELSDCFAASDLLRPMRFIRCHSRDDDVIHADYIEPIAKELAMYSRVLRRKKEKGVHAAHWLLEAVVGRVLVEHDPTLREDLKWSIDTAKEFAEPIAMALGEYYDKNWRSFYHALQLSRFFYNHVQSKRDSFCKWCLSHAFGKHERFHPTIRFFMDAITYVLQVVPISLVPIRLYSVAELNPEQLDPEVSDLDLDSLLSDAKQKILEFEQRKRRRLRGRLKGAFLPYLHHLHYLIKKGEIR